MKNKNLLKEKTSLPVKKTTTNHLVYKVLRTMPKVFGFRKTRQVYQILGNTISLFDALVKVPVKYNGRKNDHFRKKVDFASYGVIMGWSLYQGISKKNKYLVIQGAVLGVGFAGMLLNELHNSKIQQKQIKAPEELQLKEAVL